MPHKSSNHRSHGRNGRACTALARWHRHPTRVAVLAALTLLLVGLVTVVTDTSSIGDAQQETRNASALTVAQGSDPPVADAGLNRTYYEGAIAALNGSDSYDDVGIVDYVWTFNYNGTLVTLDGETAVHIFWTTGVYNISLNVTDADSHWDIDSVTYTILEDTEPPVIRCWNRTVLVGATVNLSASQSTDNARIVNFTWSFVYAGEAVELYGETIQFTFNRSGTYNVTIVVTDASGLSSTSYIIVQVNKEVTWLAKNWFKLTIAALVIIGAARFLVLKLRKDKTLFTSSDREKIALQVTSFKKTWKIFRANKIGMTGFVALHICTFCSVSAALV